MAKVAQGATCGHPGKNHGRGLCRACYLADWRSRNPKKPSEYSRRWQAKQGADYGRRVWMKNEYGLSLNEWDEMFLDQEGRCRICLLPPAGRLNVDHDHETGQIRGLLCRPCNTALGFMRDDPERLRRAIDYLEAA